ncbi:hypothetical protein [Streptomyces sp. HUAS TT20]|uniref:hypothetical protein n=1 Tax=Streptomyces sp. HUAS TT20 TaxID=3447509 RepID=UPI0021DA0A14|nr:hypothetical protein [Streptomyces sp. HUAS 15-9]UXY32171.1 hypothetical protein N8I87_40350 [Streptomyces sp. HUAS 15-9]
MTEAQVCTANWRPVEIRDAVARGLPLTWLDYRPASDGMAQAVWRLRQAARHEFDGNPLDLDQLAAVQTPDIAERLRHDPQD